MENDGLGAKRMSRFGEMVVINREMVEFNLYSQGINMSDLSKRMGKSVGYIAQAVRRGAISRQALENIAAALGTDVESLILKEGDDGYDDLFPGPICRQKGVCFAREVRTGRCTALTDSYREGETCPFQKNRRFGGKAG